MSLSFYTLLNDVMKSEYLGSISSSFSKISLFLFLSKWLVHSLWYSPDDHNIGKNLVGYGKVIPLQLLHQITQDLFLGILTSSSSVSLSVQSSRSIFTSPIALKSGCRIEVEVGDSSGFALNDSTLKWSFPEQFP